MDKKHIKRLTGLLVLLTVTNITTFVKVFNLNNRLDTIFNRVNEIDMNVSNSIANISSNVSAVINEKNSLINNFEYEYGKFKNGMIDIKLTVNPKEISSEDKYFFSYTIDGREELTEAKVTSPSKVSVDILVPIDKSLDINFIIEDKETKEIEILGYIYAFEERLVEPFRFEQINGGYTYHHTNNTLELSKAGYSVTFAPYDYRGDKRDESLEGVSLYVSVNGHVIDKFSMKKSADSFPSHLEDYRFIFDKYTVELKPKDKLEVYALAKHGDGYEVKGIFESLALDKDGNPDHSMGFLEDNKSIIY